jgi:zinc and cadmium transporter
MPLIAWILIFTTLGGVLSALAASLFLAASESVRTRVLPHLVSFATGALLSAALLGLLPHAIETAGPANTHAVGLTLLIGLLIFFVLEKMVLWRHCHQEVCEGHIPHSHDHADDHHANRAAASASLILIGDGFHNVLDGVLIAAAFMTDVHLGIVTALAVFTHEIPQEVGDLAILLHGGMSRLRALTLNLLTSLTSVIGGLFAWLALKQVTQILPYAIALAASSFLYIAVADLIPGLHRRVDVNSGVKQFVFIVLGVAVIYVGHSLAH